ncbi:hypothetical protein [Halorientalis halophila]|uniref:hypothetical protein n=1 Tax=Halorientalis halophila TaxID=3108499 RepID=UPI003009F0FB
MPVRPLVDDVTVRSRLGRRPSLPLGLLGVGVGFAVGGGTATVLGGTIGFFFGKSLRSVVRTFRTGTE